MKPDKIAAAFVLYPRSDSETNARLLIKSVRAFGGSMSGITLWCLVPEAGPEVSKSFRGLLDAAGVQLSPFRVDADALQFPLAAGVAAAELAEEKARERYDLLAWLGANTIVFREPMDFLIPDHARIGYCPVHHINIGSPADRPPDPFWKMIYRSCQVPENRIFTMQTHVDARRIRPYFNAGSLVVRPGLGLFKSWSDVFFRAYQQPEYHEFYRRDERYAIFMHQAILTGVTLALLEHEEMHSLPPSYNYPLHLWAQDTTGFRPRRLSDLVTVRHEGLYRDPGWQSSLPEGTELIKWLAENID